MARSPNLAKLSVDALLELRQEIGAVLSKKADALKSQLSLLGDGGAGNGVGNGRRKSVKGRKIAPKYRSKKDPKLTWAGRGATPVWMREEMKAGKFKKDSFLIK
jgi:DNA-binding protein H-NS